MQENSRSKRIAKNTCFLYIRMFLVMAVSLYTVRVVLRTLGVEDYGIYSAVGGIVTSLSFVTSVLASASQRFFSIDLGKNDLYSLKKTFSVMVFLYIIVALLILLIAETIGLWFLENKMTIPESRMDAAYWVFQCSIITFIISVVSSPYQALIIAKEKMNIYSIVGIVDVILKLILVYLLVFVDIDKLKLYSMLMVAVTISCQSVYALYSFCSYRETHLSLMLDKNIVRSVLSFSTWSVFGSLSFICNSQGVNLILNVFFGPIVNAAYMIGNQIKTTVNLFSSNFYIAVRPTMIKEYATGNMAYVRKLVFFSTKAIFSLLFVIVFPISMEIDGILKLWLGEVGDYMVIFVRLMLVYAIIVSLSDPLTTIAQASGSVKKYYLQVDGFTLLTLPISYFAFQLGFSPEFVFVISIVIFLCAHFIRLHVVRNYMPLSISDYTISILVRIAIVVLVTFILSMLAVSWLSDSLISMIVSGLIEVLISAVSCYLFLLNKFERLQLRDLFLSRFRK